MINYLFTKTPLVFLVQSLWRDEAFSYFLAKKNILQIVFLTAKDFNPPLYYLLLHFWMKFFGSSEIALRIFSLLAFWATLYIIYLILTEILRISSKKSFIYLLFFLFNPLLLCYAFEVRMYSLFAFFATACFYAFYRKKKWLYFTTTLLGLYTHYFMFFAVASQLIYLVILKKNKIKTSISIKSIIPPLVFFIPWIIYVSKMVTTSGSFWIAAPNLIEIFYLPAFIFTGYELAHNYLPVAKDGTVHSLIYLSLVLLVVTIAGYFQIKKKNKKEISSLFYYLAIWGLGIPLAVFFISFIKPIFLPRYLIFTTVGLFLLLIVSFKALPKLLQLITLFLLVITIFYSFTLKTTFQTKANMRETIGEIKKLANKDDLLYVTSELDYLLGQYYFDENRVYIYGKTYEEIPNYVGKVLISKDAIVTSLPRYPKKAFILKSDQTYDIQAVF